MFALGSETQQEKKKGWGGDLVIVIHLFPAFSQSGREGCSFYFFLCALEVFHALHFCKLDFTPQGLLFFLAFSFDLGCGKRKQWASVTVLRRLLVRSSGTYLRFVSRLLFFNFEHLAFLFGTELLTFRRLVPFPHSFGSWRLGRLALVRFGSWRRRFCCGRSPAAGGAAGGRCLTRSHRSHGTRPRCRSL